MKKNEIQATGERTIPNQRNLYEFERIYRWVAAQYGERNRSALDFGCGAGYGCALLTPFFKQVIGVDISPEAIGFCTGKYHISNLHFQVIAQDRQPFEDRSFDFIGSFQVLEHLPADSAARYIRHICNMLGANGCAIITTPNAANYYGGHSGNPFHMKEYYLLELEALVSGIPADFTAEIYTVADVWSTRLRLFINRTFYNAKVGHRLGWLFSNPVAFLERQRIIPCGYAAMVGNKTRQVIGGFMIKLRRLHA